MIPKSIKLSSNKKSIQIEYHNNNFLILKSSFLREHSPSAENKNKKQIEKLKNTFSSVLINKIESVGNYAIRLVFDDGHNTGIFSWEYLYKIGVKAQDF